MPKKIDPFQERLLMLTSTLSMDMIMTSVMSKDENLGEKISFMVCIMGQLLVHSITDTIPEFHNKSHG